MKDGFEIRKATAADEAGIAKAWEEAYGYMARYKYPDRWRWNVLGNPYVEEDRRPLVWIAANGDEVAAWTSAFVVPLHAGGVPMIGAHSVDTFTLPRYRKRGFGHILQEENRKAHAVFLAIDPSPANRRNKYRIGGRPGKPLATYLKLLGSLDGKILYDSAMDAVEGYLGHRGKRFFSRLRETGGEAGTRILFCAGFRLRQIMQGRNGHLAGKKVTLTEVPEFGEEFDLLWKEVVPRYSFSVRRDSAYLNWKYSWHPHLSYRRFLASEGDRPVGALIYRFPMEPPEQKVGIVCECFCVDDDPEVHASLLARAEADFASHGIPMIKCGASTPNQEQALRSLGYQKVDIDVPVVHLSPEERRIDLPALMAKEWLLSLGDSDLDQIRISHQPTFVESVRLFLGRIPGEENIPPG